MTTAAPGTIGLADQLKSHTADLHLAAERHPAMGGLMRGTLPISALVDQFREALFVHRALEKHLAAERTRAPFAGLIHDYHFRAPLYERDIRDLGGSPEGPIGRASARLIGLIDAWGEHSPAVLLGVMYVLEGSTNGAKFIGKALARAYGLENGRGLSAQDPHGDLQIPRWREFRAGLDAVEADEHMRGDILAAARATFEHAIGVMNELAAKYPAAPGALPIRSA